MKRPLKNDAEGFCHDQEISSVSFPSLNIRSFLILSISVKLPHKMHLINKAGIRESLI